MHEGVVFRNTHPLNPLPDDKFQTLPEDNFKFDENGRKLSEWIR